MIHINEDGNKEFYWNKYTKADFTLNVEDFNNAVSELTSATDELPGDVAYGILQASKEAEEYQIFLQWDKDDEYVGFCDEGDKFRDFVETYGVKMNECGIEVEPYWVDDMYNQDCYYDEKYCGLKIMSKSGDVCCRTPLFDKLNDGRHEDYFKESKPREIMLRLCRGMKKYIVEQRYSLKDQIDTLNKVTRYLNPHSKTDFTLPNLQEIDKVLKNIDEGRRILKQMEKIADIREAEYEVVKNIKITDITLLPSEDVSRAVCPGNKAKDLFEIGESWWLRSNDEEENVGGNTIMNTDCEVGHSPSRWIHGVRPALKIERPDYLNSGESVRFEYAGHSWHLLPYCDYALCDDIIARMPFTDDKYAPDRVAYDKSDVKKFLYEWAAEKGIEFDFQAKEEVKTPDKGQEPEKTNIKESNENKKEFSIFNRPGLTEALSKATAEADASNKAKTEKTAMKGTETYGDYD